VFDKNDIDTFTSKEELLKKVQFYLHHDKLRVEMKNRSYKHAIKNYDSIAAFKNIFHNINSLEKKNEKELILDDIFIKIHNTFHFFYVVTFFINKQYKFMFEEIKYIIKKPTYIYADLKYFLVYVITFYYKKFEFKKNCHKIIDILENKKVVIYGAGVHTTNLFKSIPALKDLNIQAIADNNSTLWGKKKNGYTIILPQDIPKYANHVIISSAKFEQEIKKNLHEINKGLIIHTLYNDFKEDLVVPQNDPYQKEHTQAKIVKIPISFVLVLFW